ncbi:MAG TPA: hypothetical protein VK886_22315 [Vicinamibacterales bacterium]|nr:hypothetical protein [Vicinamibacterales bacterium]
MVRFLLTVILIVLVVQAVWRLVSGVRRGLGLDERRPGGRLDTGVALSRDPVCGTYVVPGRALAARDGALIRYFCSERCRDEFARKARTAR